MASSSYDWDAKHDLVAANQKVLDTMIQYLESACKGDIPPAAIKSIATTLRTLGPVCKFHENIAKGIVQVDVNFNGEINNKDTENYLKMDTVGKFGLRSTLIYLRSNRKYTKKKHIGFEIHFKTKSKVTGHAWCDAVSKGRPGTGVRMNESTTPSVTETFPNTDIVTYSVTTHTL